MGYEALEALIMSYSYIYRDRILRYTSYKKIRSTTAVQHKSRGLTHLKRGEHATCEIRQALHPQGAGLAHLRSDQQRDVGRQLQEHVVPDRGHRDGHIPAGTVARRDGPRVGHSRNNNSRAKVGNNCCIDRCVSGYSGDTTNTISVVVLAAAATRICYVGVQKAVG